MFEREARGTLERLQRGFPVVWIAGPRQSGKTTLARATRPDLPYVTLERPDGRAFAREDPRGFLAAYPDGAILDVIQPHCLNVTTRLVKTPKLVFQDVGLMAYLLGIMDVPQIAAHPLRGAMFETWGITEQLKSWRNAGSARQLAFLRDKRGTEVDLVAPTPDGIEAVEFKSGSTFASDWGRGFRLWRERTPDREVHSTVVFGGEGDTVRSGVRALGWREYASLGGVIT